MVIIIHLTYSNSFYSIRKKLCDDRTLSNSEKKHILPKKNLQFKSNQEFGKVVNEKI